MATISQTTFSIAFSWTKIYKFQLIFTEVCSQGPTNNIPASVQIMAWRRSGDKPLTEPMMIGLVTHICVTRPQWVKRHQISYISQQQTFNVAMTTKIAGKSRTMTSSNWNIFHVTGHLCGEFTGPRWNPRTKASDAELWCFLWSASE